MKKTTLKKGITTAVMLAVTTATLSALPSLPKKKAKKSTANTNNKSYVAQKDSKGKVWNFDGMQISLIDWWSGQDAESKPPVSKQDEDARAWHKWTQNTYNFKFNQKQIAGWDSHPQRVADFCVTGGSENYIFIVDDRSIVPGLRSGLFYDVSTIKSVDWAKSKWSLSNRATLTKGKSFYDLTVTRPEPRTGVFFNKRLLEEAGIDPDEPYNLQKAGKWTWATFEDLLKKTTRDLDNDGVPDTYGMANSSSEFVPIAVMSNGVKMIDKDKSGKFINCMGTDESLEALNWSQYLAANYEKPQPQGSNWDWMYPAFVNGEIAFLVDEEYNCQPNGKIHNMKDDYGFVCFPLGPHGGKVYKTLHHDNFYVLPSFYDKERAEKIVKAFDLWSDPVPGYDSDDAWKEAYYASFRDERAVDETLQLMIDTPNARYDKLIPGINYMGDYIWTAYAGGQTAQQAYENTKNPYQALLDEANK